MAYVLVMMLVSFLCACEAPKQEAAPEPARAEAAGVSAPAEEAGAEAVEAVGAPSPVASTSWGGEAAPERRVESRIELAEVGLEGDCDRENAEAVFARENLQSSLDHCYQRALKVDPQAGGEVVVALKVREGGRGSSYEVRSSTFEGDQVAGCAAMALSRQRFAAESVGCEVTYRVVFSSASADRE